jgi:putative ATP-dependent endonuclease of the OLD family
VKEKCTFFLTTHSSTVIDLFSKDEQAQLLHVSHDGAKAVVQPATSYLRQCHLLDDLDVRASDLLQANVVVWVEGPSDRLYFNRWVELWSEGRLQEQVHYQCVWYGGAMLAGVTFEPEVPDNDLVSALKVNRHAIVLMDSDRRSQDDPLKARVQRVCDEAGRNGAFAWVTSGREVENYIPIEALRPALKRPDLEAPAQFGNVYEHIGRAGADKVDLARLVTSHFTLAMLAATRDLVEKLESVCRLIRQWNGLSA